MDEEEGEVTAMAVREGEGMEAGVVLRAVRLACRSRGRRKTGR